VLVSLSWHGDLRFRVDPAPPGAGAVPPTLVFDSAGQAGPSPVTALVGALAGCMAIDLALILRKGRHAVRDIQARLEATRAETEPRRLISARLHFRVFGDVPASAVERAIALSRDKYCSVWHSLRPDLEFQVTCAIEP
jgi:putative redox protein